MKYSNEDEVFEAADAGRSVAVLRAKTYASWGHFATVYAPDGEAVFELKGA